MVPLFWIGLVTVVFGGVALSWAGRTEWKRKAREEKALIALIIGLVICIISFLI